MQSSAAGWSRQIRNRLGRLKRSVGSVARPIARSVTQSVVQATTVRFVGWDTIEISLLSRLRRRRCRLDGPTQQRVKADLLRVEVPDPAALDLLAASGVLTGGIREVHVRVATVPTWLKGGVRLPRPTRDAISVRWRATGTSLEVGLGWRKRRHVGRALADVSAMVLRPRRLDQLSGAIQVADRATWLAGNGTWPQAVLDAKPAREHGPFTAAPASDRPVVGVPISGRPVPGRVLGSTIGTAVANPHGRRLFGAAAHLWLVSVRPDRLLLQDSAGKPVLTFTRAATVESVLLSASWPKYAVVEIGPSLLESVSSDSGLPESGPPDSRLPDPAFVHAVLRGLAVCGVVFATSASGVRDRLAGLGLAVVEEAATVCDLAGYQQSIAASRQALIAADPVLRRTALAGDPVLQLPTISVLVASKRDADVIACLDDLAAQTYPSYEVVVGTHGYTLDEDKVAELRLRLPGPLRVVPVPTDQTLGQALGMLSRLADGELVSKVDDDDHYGPQHLTDLLLASRTSGADLVAKSARFVQLVDEGVTIDRTWAAVEAFEVVPAGGTLLLSRGVLQACGGWTPSPRHVDAELLTRIRAMGGLTYRTHGLGYVYVRRGHGHTWQADSAEIREDNEVVYDGLPAELLAGGPL